MLEFKEIYKGKGIDSAEWQVAKAKSLEDIIAFRIFKDTIQSLRASEVRWHDEYFSTTNDSAKLSRSLYLRDKQFVSETLDTLNNKLAKLSPDPARERMVNSLEDDLYEYAELMHRARMYAKPKYLRRRNTWMNPEKIRFTLKDWHRLNYLNTKYYPGDNSIEKIGETVLHWAHKKLDFDRADFARQAYKDLIVRNVDPNDPQNSYLQTDYAEIVLQGRLKQIGEYFSSLQQIEHYFSTLSLHHTTASFLSEIILDSRHYVEINFRMMAEYWEELRRFEAAGEVPDAAQSYVNFVYDELYDLEYKYRDIDHGSGLKELEIMKEKLKNLGEKPLQQWLGKIEEQKNTAKEESKNIDGTTSRNIEMKTPDRERH